MNSRIIPITIILSLAYMAFSCSNNQTEQSVFEVEPESEATVVGNPLDVLVNSMWVLIEFDGESINQDRYEPKIPHLLFSSDENRFSGNMGCNQLMGSFTLENDNLNFSQVASTKMLCAEMELEDAFGKMVEKISMYQFNQNRLVLLDEDEIVIAIFEAQELNR